MKVDIQKKTYRRKRLSHRGPKFDALNFCVGYHDVQHWLWDEQENNMSVKSELEVAKRELEEVKRKANGLENKVAQLERRLGRGPVTFKAVVTNFHHNYGDHYGSVEFSLRVTGFHDAAIVRLREVMSEGCGCVPLVVTLEDDK